MIEYSAAGTAWDALLADLKKDIATSKPASLLSLTTLDLDIENLFHVSNTVSIRSAEALDRYLESSPADRKFDLAVILFEVKNIKNDSYLHLISKLRDTDCSRVYLACSVPPKVADKQYDACVRALGFKLLHVYNLQSADKVNICLYYYDIYDYKEVPDWLNDRFWAHPNMWDKARW